MLKILPENGQQLRSKHVAALINKFALHCTHVCTLPRPCLKTLQRKNAPEEKTHRKCHWMQRCSMPFECFVLIGRVIMYTQQSARFDSFPQGAQWRQVYCGDSVSVCECYSKYLFSKQSLSVLPHGLKFIAVHLYRQKPAPTQVWTTIS